DCKQQYHRVAWRFEEYRPMSSLSSSLHPSLRVLPPAQPPSASRHQNLSAPQHLFSSPDIHRHSSCLRAPQVFANAYDVAVRAQDKTKSLQARTSTFSSTVPDTQQYLLPSTENRIYVSQDKSENSCPSP